MANFAVVRFTCDCKYDSNCYLMSLISRVAVNPNNLLIKCLNQLKKFGLHQSESPTLRPFVCFSVCPFVWSVSLEPFLIFFWMLA